MLAPSLAAAADNAGPPAVPVSVAKAVRRNLPIYLQGLGTIQAYNTVTIRPQIDGQLIKLAVTEGQDVHTGDLLFVIDPRPFQAAFDQALAKKAQDEALLANARLDLQRYAQLVERNYVARQQLDTTQAQVNQLQAAVQGDDAAIESARVTLGYTSIRSPIDGRVGIRNVDVGNIVHASDGTGMLVITQIRPIFVIFTLPEAVLQRVLKAGSAGRLKVAAISRDGTQLLDDGTLDLVDNQVDQTTGTVRLRATLPNKAARLWPGQFVNARLEVEHLSAVLTVPIEAIQRGPQGSYAFVVKADGTVELRNVALGEVSEGVAVIANGIAEGETVVTAGQYRLQPGSRVELKPEQTTAR